MTDHQPPPPRWEDLIEMSDDQALATIDAHIETWAAVEAIGRLEELARSLFRARWPGKSWTGCDVSRSYWRRKARAALDRRAEP